MKRFLLVVLFTLVPLSLFAANADIWSDDVRDNPAKLFFSSSSLFVGEVKYTDTFFKEGSSQSTLQEPVLDLNISVLGGVMALNLGATTKMIGKNTDGLYEGVKSSYVDIMIAYGYKYFSLGVNLSLSDYKTSEATLSRNLSFFSFLGESFFRYYTNVSSSVDTSLGLSLILTDGNYFSFGVFATNMLVFGDTTATVNGEYIYKNINFGISAKSPKYNKLDDLVPVEGKVSIDAIKIFDDDKEFRLFIDLSLVLSPTMKASLHNKFNFYTFKNDAFNINDKKFFMHTLSASFESRTIKIELGALLSPNLYQGKDRELKMFLSLKFFI